MIDKVLLEEYKLHPTDILDYVLSTQYHRIRNAMILSICEAGEFSIRKAMELTGLSRV